MKKLLTFACCFLVLGTVLTGCGSGKKDGYLYVAVGKNTALLDPSIVDDSVTANILNQTYEGLYRLGSDGKPVPAIAEGDPTVSEDGLTYTIKMKKGIKWSDGQELTAKDFVYSWKRAVTTAGYYTNFIFNNIVGSSEMKDDKIAPYMTMDELKDFGAVATDDYTITITLKQATPYFHSLLTNTVFYPLREDVVGEDYTKSNWAESKDVPTIGAFKYSSIKTEDEVVIVKNTEYHDADKVKLEGVSFKVMPDMDAETNAFEKGDIDFATSINKQTLNSKEELQKSKFVIDPFVCNYFILLNSGDENDQSTDGLKALKDPEIRKAINQAVDRTAILDVIGYGDSAYVLKGLIPSGIPGTTGDFREEADAKGAYGEFNQAEAKATMEAKGYSDAKMLSLKYTYNDNQMHKDVAQRLQEDMKAIHIDLQLTTMDGEAFFGVRDNGEFEMARHAMTADFIDPMAYLSMYFGNTTLGNTVDDKTFEAMLDAANAETDPNARLEKLHEAEAYLVQEKNYVVPLFGYSEPYLLNQKVKGITSSPEGHYDLRFAYFE